MDYLIYDEEGEFIDVIQFESQEALASYKQANPFHFLELAEDIEEHFLIEDELDELDDELLEDEDSIW